MTGASLGEANRAADSRPASDSEAEHGTRVGGHVLDEDDEPSALAAASTRKEK